MTLDFTGLNKLFLNPTVTEDFIQASEKPLEAPVYAYKGDNIEISLEAIKTAV